MRDWYCASQVFAFVTFAQETEATEESLSRWILGTAVQKKKHGISEDSWRLFYHPEAFPSLTVLRLPSDLEFTDRRIS
jgi:hypothetical protein